MRARQKHSRTRYYKKPRKFFEEADEDDEPEDPINGPGQEEQK